MRHTGMCATKISSMSFMDCMQILKADEGNQNYFQYLMDVMPKSGEAAGYEQHTSISVEISQSSLQNVH